MWKVLGIIFLLAGVAGVLYNWITDQRKRQKWLEEFIVFLQRSIAGMETDTIRVIDYFARQKLSVFHEISRRLSTNTYPNGQAVWEEVFKEEEQNLSFDKETFQVILHVGNGFFGKSREENVRFLKKSISELEECQRKLKEKNIQERKVWVPVGMLGALMIVIIFV